MPYPILVTSFRPARKPGFIGSQLMIEHGWYNEKWEIAVYPVTRELRHLANRLLCEQGIEHLLLWLNASQVSGWTSRYHRYELVFSPTEKIITAHEFNEM